MSDAIFDLFTFINNNVYAVIVNNILPIPWAREIVTFIDNILNAIFKINNIENSVSFTNITLASVCSFIFLILVIKIFVMIFKLITDLFKSNTNEWRSNWRRKK